MDKLDWLKIEYVKISEIKPYKRNAKLHPKAQIEQIKRSMLEMGDGDALKGFLDPIGVWNNEIVEGHGRYLAAKELKLDVVPIIRLNELTDEQRRAYGIIHNQLTMNSGFDLEMLDIELDDIELDMEQFGFNERKEPEIDDYEDERDPSCQHNVFENQERVQFPISNYYGIPDIAPTHTTGDKFIRFMDWKEVDDPENYIAHFYYDDYKFMSAWRDPDKYIDRLKQFKAVVAPDFSSYTDFPIVLQILGAYRRNWVGAYWQMMGIDIISDVQWGNKETYKWCFNGIPKHATVAISSLGVANQNDWNGKENQMFKQGFDEMMKRIAPETILWYGNKIDGCEGNIIYIPSYCEEKFRAKRSK